MELDNKMNLHKVIDKLVYFEELDTWFKVVRVHGSPFMKKPVELIIREVPEKDLEIADETV